MTQNSGDNPVPAAAASPPRPRADSLARDHLANERTFLAWVRTGIALVGFGILIAKIRYALVSNFGPDAALPAASGAGSRSALLGAAFSLLGIFVIVLGAGRYAAGERALTRGEPLAPRPGQLYALAALLVLLGIAVLLYLSDLWQP